MSWDTTKKTAKHCHHEHESAGYPAGYSSAGHPAKPNAGAAFASAAADAGTANSQHAESGKRHTNTHHASRPIAKLTDKLSSVQFVIAFRLYSLFCLHLLLFVPLFSTNCMFCASHPLTASAAANLWLAAASGRAPLPAATHAAKLWLITASSAGLQCARQRLQLPSAQPRSLPAAATASSTSAAHANASDAVRQRARPVHVAARSLHAAAEHLQRQRRRALQ